MNTMIHGNNRLANLLRWHSKLACTALITAAVVLIAGCGNGSSSDSTPSAAAPSSLPIPERVQGKINSNASNVAATISIDDGAEQAMTISGNAATFEANGLVPGNHKVVITFYQVAGNERIILAQHTSQVEVVAGQTSTLGQGGLVYETDSFDRDGDQIPNVDDDDNDNDGIGDENEIAFGMNPFNEDSDGDGTRDGDEVITIVAAIPAAVQSRVTSQGVAIAAFIRVNDGTEVEMSLANGAASFSTPELAPGNHAIVIAFYQTSGSGRMELARHTGTITVVAGQDVAVDAGTYDTDFDLDADGTDNIADQDNDNDGIRDAIEPLYGLNPFNGDSDGDTVNDATEIQLTAVSTPVPAAVTARINNIGIQIEATIKVGSAAEQPMQIASNIASAQITGLLPGQSATLVITFYQVAAGSRTVLARNTTDVTIAPLQQSILGANELAYNVAFDRDDDDINNIDDIDNDNDGIDDPDEAQYGKNPFDRDSDNDSVPDADEIATQISGRGDHTCILLFSGKVRCWGFNEDGELGNGESGNNRISFAPVAVSTIDDVTSVRASITHSCALRQGGNVSCWGSNAFGEISGSAVDSTVPVEVGSLANATDVQLTLGVSCGIIGGNLACIGDVSGLASNPVAAFIGDAASAVGAGAYHSCIVAADATVSCYGAYLSGQLGDGNIVLPPLGPVTAQNINTAVAVAVGANHSCAQLQSGTIQCWGANGDAQLGDGTTITRLTPVNVGTVVAATALAVGSDHNCALEAGLVRCWGSNAAGQLGNGSSDPSSANPVLVSGITNAIAISAGEGHSCAVLANGRVMCWGSNGYGQLGSGTAPGDLASSNVPVFVSGF